MHYGVEPNPKPQTLNPKPSTTVLGESLGLVLVALGYRCRPLELTLHCLGVWACGAQGTEVHSSEAISEDALTWHHRNEAYIQQYQWE